MTSCILDDYVFLDDYSVTPRYQQLATSILTAVEQRVLQPGDVLPSINEVCVNYDISKGTVTKAYKELQQKGVIVSSPRKPSRVANKQVDRRIPVLLLLQTVCDKKQQWMDAFLAAMQKEVTVEVLIANRPMADLQELLERKAHQYKYCIVWLEEAPNAQFYQWRRNSSLKEKLVTIQNSEQPEARDVFVEMCCNEKRGFAAGLKKLAHRIVNYHTITLLQTKGCPADNEVADGLQQFCSHYGLLFSATDAATICLQKGDAFFCSTEAELVHLVKAIEKTGLQIGEDIGVVALFETPLMRFLANGITTIAADYVTAGEEMVRNIIDKKGQTLMVPFRTISRASL